MNKMGKDKIDEKELKALEELDEWNTNVYNAVGGTDKDMVVFLLNMITYMSTAQYGHDVVKDFIISGIKRHNKMKMNTNDKSDIS